LLQAQEAEEEPRIPAPARAVWEATEDSQEEAEEAAEPRCQAQAGLEAREAEDGVQWLLSSKEQ
jgi:hypothetical protein